MKQLIGKCLALAALVLLAPLAQARLTATVDHTSISELDLVNYVLRLEDATTTDSPNFSTVERDFDIVQQSGPNRSSRIVIANGRQQSESYTEWRLTLRPKRLGQLTIPAFRVGSEVSQPISINVREASVADTQRMNQFVFFETAVNKKKVYVQEQLIYTVKLYYVDSISGDFPPPPRPGDAVVETIENEKRFEAIVDNRRYYVLEKQYAIYPQHSGTLEIPRETFTGTRGRGSFFSARERVTAVSEGHRLEVAPRPAAFTGDYWLPAQEVTLEENWSTNYPNLTVGEPVNRTLVLRAVGQASSLLPPFEASEIEGAKTYQDPPETNDIATGRGIVATLATTVGIVPTRDGRLEIPEIRIPWWNTDMDRQEVAVIPARTLQVAAGAAPTVTVPPPTTPQPAGDDTTVTPATWLQSQFWLYATIALAALWILTLWQLHQTRRDLRGRDALSAVETEPEPTLSERNAFERLKRACDDSDAHAAHRQLFIWGKMRFPNVHSLSELGRVTGSTALLQEINALEAALYAPDANASWDGANLLTAVADVRRQPAAPRSHSHLVPNLNPS